MTLREEGARRRRPSFAGAGMRWLIRTAILIAVASLLAVFPRVASPVLADGSGDWAVWLDAPIPKEAAPASTVHIAFITWEAGSHSTVNVFGFEVRLHPATGKGKATVGQVTQDWPGHSATDIVVPPGGFGRLEFGVLWPLADRLTARYQATVVLDQPGAYILEAALEPDAPPADRFTESEVRIVADTPATGGPIPAADAGPPVVVLAGARGRRRPRAPRAVRARRVVVIPDRRGPGPPGCGLEPQRPRPGLVCSPGPRGHAGPNPRRRV